MEVVSLRRAVAAALFVSVRDLLHNGKDMGRPFSSKATGSKELARTNAQRDVSRAHEGFCIHTKRGALGASQALGVCANSTKGAGAALGRLAVGGCLMGN
jgi:hypothetical protein